MRYEFREQFRTFFDRFSKRYSEKPRDGVLRADKSLLSIKFVRIRIFHQRDSEDVCRERFKISVRLCNRSVPPFCLSARAVLQESLEMSRLLICSICLLDRGLCSSIISANDSGSRFNNVPVLFLTTPYHEGSRYDEQEMDTNLQYIT